MEKESFNDPPTAALMNEHFICVKVDREERPDLDSVYMDAVTTLTGRGGWPLSVWLTPEGTPFYGGTYFPDEPRFGMPSFSQVLQELAGIWRERRQDVENAAQNLLSHLSEERSSRLAEYSAVHEQAILALETDFDEAHGGWGPAPKFPQPMVIEYLLARHTASPDPRVRLQIERTLDEMARGGMYDQLGGGFHRYSTDDHWRVPHFEKMLYDNAQLARCYLHAWQALGNASYRRITEETLAYLVAEMRHPAGGFFSAQDADSEGEEGRFFVWTDQEVLDALGPDAAGIARRWFGVTTAGDFEGRNVLHLTAEPGSEDERDESARVRKALLEVRERRPHPARDEKVLASWNGLTLAAFSDAARALGAPHLLGTAVSLGEFLADNLITQDHSVSRWWKDGRRARVGFLEDYAAFVEGYLALYQATGDERWFTLAKGLADRMMASFAREEGGFFDTGSGHEALVVRPRSLPDTPIPSGSSLAATVLLKMAAFTGEAEYASAAGGALAETPSLTTRAPSMFGQWLCALHLSDEGLTEISLVGTVGAALTEALADVAARTYLPMAVYAFKPAGATSQVGMLEGREPPAGVDAAAWVCSNRSCSETITSAETLSRLLRPLPEES